MSAEGAPATRAAHLGVWLFLASEVLLFSGLFAVYAAYRCEFPADFARAAPENSLLIGTVNTFILLTSSLLAALAVDRYRHHRSRSAGVYLLLTLVLGAAFLTLKGIEYAEHARVGILPGAHYHYAALPSAGARAFFTLYYLLTGLHGLHVVGGMTALGAVATVALRGHYDAEHHLRVELSVLYWHLVDVVWIFLWPLLYLVH
jgi:cytochrome c oxidase subunit 3